MERGERRDGRGKREERRGRGQEETQYTGENKLF